MNRGDRVSPDDINFVIPVEDNLVYAFEKLSDGEKRLVSSGVVRAMVLLIRASSEERDKIVDNLSNM